jgi:stearoyl-CoA desaturase (Delta-9 desaturase)
LTILSATPPTIQTTHQSDKQAVPFSSAHRITSWLGTFIGLTVPVLGLVAAIVLVCLRGFSWIDLGLLVGMYLATGIGMTVGFHRLFTHRSFRTVRPVEFILGVLGSMTIQGTLFEWVGRHRLHHRHSDRAGDPHSPHPRGQGFLGLVGSFWHAHMAWAFAPNPRDLASFAGDLRRSGLLRMVNALFPLWAILGLLIPAAIGLAAGGWPGALTGFLWGGLIRVFLVHHVTAGINSVCHLWGTQPYPEQDQSRNNAILGVLALGEGWHNNHHAFPSSARQGLRWWQLDIAYWVIRALVLCRLAWNVRLPAAKELRSRRRQMHEIRGERVLA